MYQIDWGIHLTSTFPIFIYLEGFFMKLKFAPH